MKIIRMVLWCVLAISVSACDQMQGLQNKRATMLVDLDAVAQALGRDEVMKQEILSVEKQLREQLGQVAGDLQNQVKQEQEKLGANAGDEGEARLEKMALQAQQAFRQQQAAAQQKASQMRAELLQKFRDEVKAVAEPLARQQGAMMVKVISSDVLWFDPLADITDEVIAQMRAANN